MFVCDELVLPEVLAEDHQNLVDQLQQPLYLGLPTAGAKLLYVLAKLRNAEPQLLLHLQEELVKTRQFLELLLNVEIEHSVLFGLLHSHRTPARQLFPDFLELFADGEDEADGLLCLLLQLHYLEEVFVFEFSEIFEGEVAVAVAAFAPASADVLLALLMMKDEVGSSEDPAFFAF